MINCALVGYGRWGKVLYKNIILNKNLNLKIIFYNKSIDNKNINKDIILSNNYKNYNYHSIKLVFIAANSALNYEICKFYLKKKINVFIEKPLSITKYEVYSLLETAKKNKCILHVDYIHLYNKNFINFKKLVKFKLSKNSKSEIKISMGNNLCRKKQLDSYWDWGVHVFSILSTLFNINELKLIKIKKEFKNKRQGNYYMKLIYNQTTLYLSFGNSFNKKRIEAIYKDKKNTFKYNDQYFINNKIKSNSITSFNTSPLQISINHIIKNIFANKIYQCRTSKKITYIMLKFQFILDEN